MGVLLVTKELELQHVDSEDPGQTVDAQAS